LLNNIGVILLATGHPDEAIAAWRRALEIQPGNSAAWNNLGNGFKETGQIDEAVASFRKAIEIEPGYAGAHSNLVYSTLLHPAYDRVAQRAERAQWAESQERPRRALSIVYANTADPERRLRIGYVSSNFRNHVIGRNMMPLFAHRDRTQFDVVCYSSGVRLDE